LANPLAEGESHLRPTLTIGLLESLKLNQSRGVPVSRLAEVGRVFMEQNGHNFECAAAGFIVADDPDRRWKRRESVDFYWVKHHIGALAAIAGIDLNSQSFQPISGPYFGWQDGHAVQTGNIAQGWSARFGLLHLGMVQSLGIEGKVYAGILSVLPESLPSGKVERRFADFSLFPPALRDLALVVDESIPAAEVERNLAAIADSALGGAFALEQLSVFDVYQGSGLPPGKKSLAFSLVFRSPDRTLTDEQVSLVFQKIQDALAQSTRYVIRK
jgi:phenylalanyl-tRNA synthetase beta chain